MPPSAPSTLAPLHRALIERAVDQLCADPRIVGVAAAGSYAQDAMDEFSDVDLVVAVEPAAHAEVMVQRQDIASRLGPLLAAFTGEHVGEPRLLICLYGPPVLHVDLKFVSLPDAAIRVDEPVVLWEREGRLSAVLATSAARQPRLDPQWIEDRFWVWIHYAATKIGRGELFEAIDHLAFLRARVLAPLGLDELGLRTSGVRRLESLAPALADELKATAAAHELQSALRATHACIAVYRRLRAAQGDRVQPRGAAEAAAVGYLAEIEARYPPVGR